MGDEENLQLLPVHRPLDPPWPPLMSEETAVLWWGASVAHKISFRVFDNAGEVFLNMYQARRGGLLIGQHL